MTDAVLTAPHFTDPDAAREYLEDLRWPNGVVCPHCGSISKDHYQLQGEAHRAGVWKCKDCLKQFSVTVGTVFEDSKVPLNKWLIAAYLMASSKKGVSSKQIERTLKVTYKTAWFMTHRLREAMKDDGGILGGGGKIVEADETFWGNIKGMTPKREGRGGGWRHKHKILSLVERDGKARSFHVADVTGATLKPILQANIAKDSHLMTDAASHYRDMQSRREYLSHETTNHARKQYAKKSRAMKGEVVHSNTVESYFGLLKRGLIGTFHHVSEAHLQKYVTEFDFRFSARERRIKVGGKWMKAGFNDVERMDKALKGIEGRRLTYRA